MSPEAYFDCLVIATELGLPMNGVGRLDFQRVSFLSCLLSLYKGKPVSEWGYRFANTGYGTPFSDQLDAAIVKLLSGGQLLETSGRLQISEIGIAMRELLGSLENHAGRITYLQAACASMLAVPLSTMASGLDQEPTVVASQLRSGTSFLLEAPHVEVLHEHFHALSRVLPDTTDLFSPSVLWLSYMSETVLSERVDPVAIEEVV